MKLFRMAVTLGIISTLILVSSFYYYQSNLIQAEHSEKKYHRIMDSRAERQAYKTRLDSFRQRWESLGELSKEKSADVSYEINLRPKDFNELSGKIVSTYEHGFFFLKSAVLESNSGGISLVVKGFKRGGTHQ
ncbi:hypothetical protein EG833_01985 [archaeon]|nr:hypothetical protein [archaeon]